MEFRAYKARKRNINVKVNWKEFASYGVTDPPKYTGEFEWGGTFEMNPKRTTLSDAEYASLVDSLKAELGL